jgi:UDP-N-acetylmuramoyl-tripeptide--D-alanyl-D-alanine ligase
LSFGEGAGSSVQGVKFELEPTRSNIIATINGVKYAYTLSAAGKHLAVNSLGILGILHALGLDIDKALPHFAGISAVKGRGLVQKIQIAGKNITLIDESYNANPLSMRAAFAVLKTQAGRKVAAIGDMLELGDEAVNLHATLANDHDGIDRFYCAGSLMKACYEALPVEKQGGFGEKALDLLPQLLQDLQEGDFLMIKGSLGSRMIDLAAALNC